MGRDISIAISARDNYTQTITTMRNANKSFNKDLDGLSDKLAALDKTKHTLRIDADNAKNALQAARKEFKALNDAAADKTKLHEAQENYENICRNLRLVESEARKTEKALMDFTDTQSRAENRVSELGRIADDKAINRLAGAGIGKMLGDSISNAFNTGISSTFGETAGTAISSAISSTLSGAAIGSIVPGIGTILGGAVGLLSGTIGATTQMFQKNDDAYKALVQQQYTGLSEKETASVSSGSALASQREIDKIAFSKLLKGDMGADDFLAQVRTMANTTPFLYTDLTSMSKTLAPAYGDDPEKMLELMRSIGDAGASVGLDVSGMNEVATALSRMKSTGKTTLEYLNIMQERGIDAYGLLATAMGKTKEKTLEMVSKGLVPGAKAAEGIAHYMGQDFAGAMEEMSRTYSGLASTLEGWQQEFDAATGEGFTATRSVGIAAKNNYYEGLGDEAMEINRLKGAYLASLDNLRDEYQMDVEKAIRTGEFSDLLLKNGEDDKAVIKLREMSVEYKSLHTQMRQLQEERGKLALGSERWQKVDNQINSLGAAQGRLFTVGESLAENEYSVSDAAKAELANQKNIIQGIQENGKLKEDYYQTGRILGERLSMGIKATMKEENPFDPYVYFDPEGHDLSNKGMNITNPNMTATGEVYLGPSADIKFPNNAFGLPYVPRDDYLARLHEGERVLTAAEARAYQSGTAPFTITGNNFNVREEADVYKIAQAIVGELQKAQRIS